MGWKDILRAIKRWRWVAWIIGAIGAALRLGWFVFSHYSWLVGLAAMISAAIGQYYSPKITEAVVVGLLAFAAVKVLGWQASLPNRKQTEVPVPAATAPQQASQREVYNFTPIRHRQMWDPPVLATVLSALDPNGEGTAETSFSWKSTVLDAMRSGDLKYIRQEMPMHRGSYYNPSDTTKIRKEDAIAWMEKIGFDTTPVK